MTKYEGYFKADGKNNSARLPLTKRNAKIENFCCAHIEDGLAKLKDGEFQVAAWMVNELKLGYYENGRFCFADGSNLEEKYLLELRVFNKQQELHLIKNEDRLCASIITDGYGDDVKSVDSTSVMFGKREEAVQLPSGFAKLIEEGRKISLVIPAKESAEKYMLTTRSYITYHGVTGQAGYGYHRWVEIVAKKEGK